MGAEKMIGANGKRKHTDEMRWNEQIQIPWEPRHTQSTSLSLDKCQLSDVNEITIAIVQLCVDQSDASIG